MKKRDFILMVLALVVVFNAKAQDTLRYSKQECEAVFLKENLMLIAQKFNISQAEAMLVQSRLWSNPVFTLDEVNLWASQKNLAVFGDELQGYNGGSFGKNSQLAGSIEQLILTAGKRKKQIDLNKISVEQAKQEFEDLLRNLKLGLRLQIVALQSIQARIELYETQIVNVKQLNNAFEKQMNLGNIPKSEFVRLKVLELELIKEFNELILSRMEAEKEIKELLNIPTQSRLEISMEDFKFDVQKVESIEFDNSIRIAKENRPDLIHNQLVEDYFNKLHSFEKAQQIPDITLKAGYDRGGNFMYNFIGFGIEMDLPIWNRNKGNILFAQAGIEQAKVLKTKAEQELEYEVIFALENLKRVIDFKENIDEDFEIELDNMLNSFTNNFKERNLSLIEYLDFLDAYLESKKLIINTEKEINEKVQEFNYSIGTDIL